MMRLKPRRSFALAGLAALAGCATVPNVDYHAMTTGTHHDSWVPFRLTDSLIVVGTRPEKPSEDASGVARGDVFAPPLSLDAATVDYGACDSANVCTPPDVRAAAIPLGDASRVLAIEPKSRQLVSTSVAPAYYPNSLRLKLLTIEAKDHKLEAISTIAAIASGAKQFTASLTGTPSALDTVAPLNLPLTIELAAARAANAVIDPAAPAGAAPPTPAPLPGNTAKWRYTITFADSPAASGFVPVGGITGVHRAMVGSLCRPARLTLYPVLAKPQPPVVLAVVVADPQWLLTVPFPPKGALVFAPLCGIDVQPQPVTEVGTDALANAFFNAVEAIRTPAY
jgi:hypothetical protein